MAKIKRAMRWMLIGVLWLGGCGGLDLGVDGGSSTGRACIVGNTRCEDGLSPNECRALSDSTHSDVLYKDGQSCLDLGYTKSCPDLPGAYKTCS